MGNSKSKRLNPAVFEDLCDITNFSTDEIHAWYKDFTEDCPDGQLSLDQFKSEYLDMFPGGASEKFAEHVFRTFDLDRDGSLNFREFILALSSLASGEPQNKLEWIFRLYDIDGTGFIRRSEVMQIAQSVNKMFAGDSIRSEDIPSAENRVNDFFDAVDKNHDELVTRDEFMEAALRDPWLAGFLQNKTFDQIVEMNELGPGGAADPTDVRASMASFMSQPDTKRVDNDTRF